MLCSRSLLCSRAWQTAGPHAATEAIVVDVVTVETEDAAVAPGDRGAGKMRRRSGCPAQSSGVLSHR